MKYAIPVLCCLAAFFLFACARRPVDSEQLLQAEPEEPVLSPEEIQQLAAAARAELVMKSLSSAYPERVGEAMFIDGEWTVEVDGTRFQYAGGKILPDYLLSEAAEYRQLLFYRYGEDIPVWTPPSAESIARMRASRESQGTSGTPRTATKRSAAFFDTLFQGASREEVISHLKYITFLGVTVRVHESIADKLTAIEAEIKALAPSDPKVASWMKNISDITTWNWRNIANSSNKSFHSYATAIDIQEKPQAGKHSYWLWSAQNGLSWWQIPYEDRQNPPDAVIKLFESYGFIWGGKWAQFDTMHFEYRPEVLLINGLQIKKIQNGP